MMFKRELMIHYLFKIFDWAKINIYLCISIYVFLGIFWVTICLPGSLLTLSAGVIFSEAIGIKGIFLAWTLGITNQFIAGQISFLICRYLLYDVLRKYFETKSFLKSVEGAIRASGYRISFLLRFAAFFPSAALNYGLSTTSMRLYQYMFGF